MARILIVDDEPDFTGGINEYLRINGHASVAANTLDAARALLSDEVPDVLVLDLMMPDGSGLELLDEFESKRPNRVVIVTGHTGVKSMIGAMVGDHVSYLQKPMDPAELLAIVEAVGDEEVAAVATDASPGSMVGQSEAMQAIYTLLERVAPTDSAVFVRGESGTGKELIAESLHNLSGRSGRFVPVNCGSLSPELLSSQLFGHEKGSFTGAAKKHTGFFEQADKGTLFLDEITEMPIDMQTHLLRVLETGRVLPVGAQKEIAVETRLVAATNRDPAEAVRDGKLREDLYFRLSVFPVTLPPLRERGDDIKLLADHFLAAMNAKAGVEKRFADDFYNRLQSHHWPGNIRELKHVIHRAHILATGDVIDAPAEFIDESLGEVKGLGAGRSIADVERDLIVNTLEQLGGDKKAAAASLGVSLKTLYNRLKAYGEDSEEA